MIGEDQIGTSGHSQVAEKGVFAPNRPLTSISETHLHATRLAAGVTPAGDFLPQATEKEVSFERRLGCKKKEDKTHTSRVAAS